MRIGVVGLGRMGANMAERLRRGGHQARGYDRDPQVSEVRSLEELGGELRRTRAAWMMVPAGEPTEQTIAALAAHLAPGRLFRHEDDRAREQFGGRAVKR